MSVRKPNPRLLLSGFAVGVGIGIETTAFHFDSDPDPDSRLSSPAQHLTRSTFLPPAFPFFIPLVNYSG